MSGRSARERETAKKHEWDGDDVGRMPPGATADGKSHTSPATTRVK